MADLIAIVAGNVRQVLLVPLAALAALAAFTAVLAFAAFLALLVRVRRIRLTVAELTVIFSLAVFALAFAPACPCRLCPSGRA